MKKFGKFLQKAKGVLGDKGKDIGQLAFSAATGDFKGVVKEVGDILGMDTSEEGKALSEEFKLKLEEFELEGERIEAADRASARGMQKEALAGNDNFSKRFIYYLALAVLGFSFVIVILLFWVEIPKENQRILDMTLGAIVTSGLVSVLSYFFGASDVHNEKKGS